MQSTIMEIKKTAEDWLKDKKGYALIFQKEQDGNFTYYYTGNATETNKNFVKTMIFSLIFQLKNCKDNNLNEIEEIAELVKESYEMYLEKKEREKNA